MNTLIIEFFYITAAEYIDELKSIKDKEYRDKYENVDILIMDNIEYIINDLNAKSELFNTFNKLYSDNKQIVFGSSKTFDELSGINEKLRNIISWGITIDINQTSAVDETQTSKDKSDTPSFDYNWLD